MYKNVPLSKLCAVPSAFLAVPSASKIGVENFRRSPFQVLARLGTPFQVRF